MDHVRSALDMCFYGARSRGSSTVFSIGAIYDVAAKVHGFARREMDEACPKVLGTDGACTCKRPTAYWVPAAHFNGPTRRQDDIERLTGLVFLDFDGMTEEEAVRFRDRAAGWRYTAACWLSRHRRGVHVFVATDLWRLDPGEHDLPEAYKTTWLALARTAETVWGRKPDPAVKSAANAAFYGADFEPFCAEEDNPPPPWTPPPQPLPGRSRRPVRSRGFNEMRRRLEAYVAAVVQNASGWTEGGDPPRNHRFYVAAIDLARREAAYPHEEWWDGAFQRLADAVVSTGFESYRTEDIVRRARIAGNRKGPEYLDDRPGWEEALGARRPIRRTVPASTRPRIPFLG